MDVHADHTHDTCADSCGAPALNRRTLLGASAAVAAVMATAGPATRASGDHRRGRRTWTPNALVPGFLEVVKDEWGSPYGTGFAEENPWGAYTAHLVSVSQEGFRTWRIDNYLKFPTRPDGTNAAQDSTCWLLEGARRALLIDTAQDTPETMGVNDLSTVATHLLSHNDDGSPRRRTVDFDVAITHFHGDHTGKVHQMGERVVYFPDLDWGIGSAVPGNNWVPVRQDVGPTPHGSGRTTNEIRLGGRTIHVIKLYGHTPGSTGYLDIDNQFLATGDALGSAFVWMQFASGTTTRFLDMLRGLQRQLAPLRGIKLLPAHFDQLGMFERGKPPIGGRVGDQRYVRDLARAAAGVLDGSIPAEPYHHVGREVVWIGGGTARMAFSLLNMYPGGPSGGLGDPSRYHQVRIPCQYRLDTYSEEPYAYLRNIKVDLRMIRDCATRSMYLMHGRRRALLVGTGAGTPQLGRFVRSLLRGVGTDLDIVLTSDDIDQMGGLDQFPDARVFAAESAMIPRRHRNRVVRVGEGDTINLGADEAGRRVRLEVHPLPGHSRSSLTLLDPVSRVLYAGDALGTQGVEGLLLNAKRDVFTESLAAWRRDTDGRYDTLYTSHNHQWFTRPDYVDSIQGALAATATTPPTPRLGFTSYMAGTGDIMAWVHVRSA